ncbi:hypothetical protein Cgig2_003640 [Carnegiea gigantea]|uniref:Uncharacterized protein n=1 Tax=Carnegiea gigantea TaxID=171969 RepID=A0A9Q1GWJ1_9CARY|nr:hypothetical protein Cgig2_003640 [Carnegiea gigantea]
MVMMELEKGFGGGKEHSNHMDVGTDGEEEGVNGVTDQVKKAMEVANFVRPIPTFDYVPTARCESSHRHALARSHRLSDVSVGVNTAQAHRPTLGRTAKSTTASTPYATYSQRIAWSNEHQQTSKPPREVLGRRRTPKHRSARERTSNVEETATYDHSTETTQCAKVLELRKTLHELAEKGQIDRFLKKGHRFLHKEHEPTRPKPQEEEYSTKIVAAIASGYTEGITQSAWKPLLWGTQQVLMAKQGSRVTVP